MKLHLPVRLFKSLLTCLSAVAVGLTLGSASVTAAETQLNNSPDEEELLLYPAPLTLTSSAVSLAAYTPPSKITIPSGYRQVKVDSVSDITPYSSSATDVAFRLTADVTVDGRTSAIMTSSAGSWYFTSDSVDNLRSLSFSNATSRLLYVSSSEKLEFAGLEGVRFSGNSAEDYGGAIDGSTITLSGNGSVTFSGNSASSSYYYASGGAISGSTITLSRNGSVTFSGNSAEDSGGAIDGSTITLSGNGSVTFSGNSVSDYGGAIYGGENSTITLSGNGSVTFSRNSASSSHEAYGGAIYGGENSTITLSGNGSVTFSRNSASSDYYAYGGAIYGYNSTITLSGNGSVTFSGNSASSDYGHASGGAIYGYNSTITLSDNGSVTFSGNSATSSSFSSFDSSAYGGAIYADNLSIRNNDSVLFEKNAEVTNGTYRLRSICAGGSGDTISLSTAKGKSIVFRDSVDIDTDYPVQLNADYTDAAGKVHKQTGDIIFTGAYTEQHLNELLSAAGAGRKATEEEILNSRTTVVSTMTNLYGGRLRVEDGAVYNGHGITAMDHSAATVLVKDATLNHAGYNLTFSSGTTLELVGNSKVYADTVQMMTGSSLLLDISRTEGVYILESSLYLDGNMQLIPGKKRNGENIKLMFVSGKVDGWDDSSLTISGSAAFSVDDIQWVGHFLVANYHEATFRPYVYGNVTFAHRREAADYYFYESILFENCSTTSSNGNAYGGAIYGGENSTITLSGNGSVTFSRNTASSSSYAPSSYDDAYAYGGAIYGGENSTITLSGNGSVTFSGNTASSSYYDDAYDDAYAYGGAIDGGENSTITLSGNGSVEFSGNKASSSSFASSYAYGGAIYGGGYSSAITLSGNGSVTFSGNSASSSSASSSYASGGAIDGGTITLSNNESVTFSGNSASSSASAYGGAIYSGGYSSAITLSGNGSVTFSGNSASDSYYASGGAIYGGENSAITLSGNGSVTFSGNSASDSYYASGGAIYGGENSAITLSGNGSVTFSGNSATSSSSSDDSDASGGAIRAYGNLSIRNNDSVFFEKNAEVTNGTYRLRSIYAGESGDTISLSAAKGKSIEFRDSVYIASGSTVKLNADYTDAAGKIHKQSGDIIFTGKHTEQHLNELLAAAGLTRTATEEEIQNSRTTAIYAMTNLYGGRLRVEDGAIFIGQGITAAEGSAATVQVKNATLNHAGNNLTFSSGTTLSLCGNNNLSGNLQFKNGSNLQFYVEKENSGIAATTHSGSLTLSGKVNVKIDCADGLKTGAYLLLETDSLKPSNWTTSCVSVSGLNDCVVEYEDLYWKRNGERNTLYLYYESDAVWSNASGNRQWNTTSSNWERDGSSFVYQNGEKVKFRNYGAGTVTLVGTLTPKSVMVNNSDGKDYIWQGSGKLSGAMKLYKKGAGTLTIKNTNTFTGGTYIYGGKVVLGADNALGSGSISISSGTLNLNGKLLSNNITASGSSVIQNGGSFRGNVTLNGTLNSGSWLSLYRDKTATLMSGYMYGKFTGVGKVVKGGSGTVVLNASNTYTGGTDIKAGTLKLGADKALGTGNVTMSGGTLDMNGKLLTNYIFAKGTVKVLNGGNYGGNFVLDGTLTAGSWLRVNSGKTATLKSGTVSGKFSGAGKVVKSSSGTVVLNASNTYTGGTDIKAGTLKLGADKALGTGNVTMSGGTLDMNGKLLTNYISAKGTVKVLNGGNYGGNFVLDGTLTAGSWLRVNSGKTATLKSGTVSGKFSGAGKVVKSSSGTVTFKGVNNCTGGTDITAGTLVLGTNNALGTGNVTMSGGTLNMNSKSLSNYITAKGSTNILNGGNFNGNYELSGNLGSNSWLRINSGKKATLRSGTMSGSLTGAGETIIAGKVNLNGGRIKTNKLTISGSGKKLTANASGLAMNKNASDVTLSNGGNLTSAGAITARNLTLSNKATLNAKNSASRNITLGGSLKATASTVNMHGNLTAGNLVLNNATLRNDGSSARAVTVTNSTSLSNNAKLNIKGYLRSKNLTLNKSSLRQHSNNRGVGLTGTLTMNSGSTLTAQGALSAANMKLSGGTINLTSTSFNTIKVSGTLTLSSAIDLNLGCKLTTGRNYTLIRFNKTNLTSRNNLAKLLGLTGSGATLTLRSTGIILKVTNAAAWNRYLAANKTAFNKAASVVNAITPAAEETEVVEIAADTATTVAAEPAYDRSSADMLVQSNWGVVNASRAFTDTLGNRASNSTAFGADKSSAVWLSAMGASSRLSSDGAAAGSDYNLFGAAVGMEQQLTEKSSLGLAIGESYGKVNSFTSARTKQDTLHTALYGQYSAVERSRDAVLLDWSAAYGRTESKWQGTEWEQKSVQLDARATWAHQLTADTTVSGFAGMQYFASESADIAPGIKSGSVQNLRGEIGVGIGHKATSKTTVYGELSFVGDMARNNPTAQTEGQRVRGANPGRAGINLSAGVNHALNEKWSVNASYNMELMERANSHSANIGASYKF